jgi:hypothetical protein
LSYNQLAEKLVLYYQVSTEQPTSTESSSVEAPKAVPEEIPLQIPKKEGKKNKIGDCGDLLMIFIETAPHTPKAILRNTPRNSPLLNRVPKQIPATPIAEADVEKILQEGNS